MLLETECARNKRMGVQSVMITFQDIINFGPTEPNRKIPSDITDVQMGSQPFLRVGSRTNQ